MSALNKQFFEWIEQHLKKNPYILISPCIRDYENHLAELTKQYASKADVVKEDAAHTAKNVDTEATCVFATAKPATAKPATANFSFGNTNQSAQFSFGQEKKSDSSEKNAFSSGSSAPGGFSFGKAAATSGNFTFSSSAGAASTFGSG